MATVKLSDKLKLKQLDMGQKRYDLSFDNAETGASFTRITSPPRWTMGFSSNEDMTPEESADWEGLVVKLRGRVNCLEAWDVGKPAPLGTVRGNLALQGSAAEGATSATLSAFGNPLVSGEYSRGSISKNLLEYSEDLSKPNWQGISSRAAAPEYHLGSRFWEISKTTMAGSEYLIQVVGAVMAGETLTATVSLLGAKSSVASVGLYDSSATTWGGAGESSFSVVEGPGAASGSGRALCDITGLSSTVPTVVRVTRTYSRSGNCWFVLYAGGASSTTAGDSVKVTRAQVEDGPAATAYAKTTSARSVAVSRASARVYFDGAGVMQTAAANTARWDHSGFRTNRLPKSQQIHLWANNGLATTADNMKAPDGTQTAATSTVQGGTRYTTATVPIGATVCVSMFVKPPTATTTVRLYVDGGTTSVAEFNPSTGQVISSGGSFLGGSSEAKGGGWYRFQMHFVTAHDAISFHAYPVAGGLHGWWGAQVETGVTQATGYIPTGDSPVTASTGLPKLLVEGAGTNLMPNSEAFDAAAWIKQSTTVTPGLWATGPNGVQYVADAIAEVAAVAQHDAYSVSTAHGRSFSVFVKFAGVRYVALYGYSAGIVCGKTFDLAAGTAGADWGAGAPTRTLLQPLADGWFRIGIESAVPFNIGAICLCHANVAGPPAYLGDITRAVYAFGAHHAPSGFPSYTPTTTTAATSDADVVTLAQDGSTLRTGDWLQVGDGLGTSQLVKVADDAVVAADGSLPITFEPPLRIPFSAGTGVKWDKPVTYYKTTSGDSKWGYSGANQGGFSFDGLETWS